jgi:hypothetical protein
MYNINYKFWHDFVVHSVFSSGTLIYYFVSYIQLFLHGNSMVNVYKEIEKCILPDEYLPDDYNGPSAGPESKIIGKLLFSSNNVGRYALNIYFYISCFCWIIWRFHKGHFYLLISRWNLVV